jgi:hypothetical protein
MDNLNETTNSLQNKEDILIQQFQEELMVHQTPLVFQVKALVEMLNYQKSLIPEHIMEPLIDCVKDHINKQLDALK